MKKILSMILVCILLLSLAALCGCADKAESAPETTTPAETDTPDAPTTDPAPASESGADKLADSKPNEYVQEKLDAGLQPLVTFVTPRLTSDFLIGVDTGLKTNFEALGYAYTTANADNDMSQIISLVENAVQMGSAAVIVLDIGEGLSDVCAAAEQSGTHIVCFGNPPLFDVAGKVLLDQGEQGKQGAYMVHAWLDVAYPDAAPGEVHAFVTTEASTEQNKARSDAYQKYLPEDARITLSYVGEHQAISVDEGFTLTQNAFTVDPEIRVGLLFNSAAAVGANNYLISNVAAEDLGQYAIFANTQDAALIELVKASAENNASCLRGTIGQGGAEGPWASAFKCATALLTGGAEYGYIQHDRIYSINGFGYIYDSEA